MFALALLVIRNYYYFSIILVINYNKLFLYSCLLNFFHDCSFALIKHKKTTTIPIKQFFVTALIRG